MLRDAWAHEALKHTYLGRWSHSDLFEVIFVSGGWDKLMCIGQSDDTNAK